MFDTDPTGWTWTTWWLYVLAGAYLIGFFLFWVRFTVGERKAKRSVAEAVRYNRMLRGFPNALYAKMFGKHPFEVPKAEAPPAPRAP